MKKLNPFTAAGFSAMIGIVGATASGWAQSDPASTGAASQTQAPTEVVPGLPASEPVTTPTEAALVPAPTGETSAASATSRKNSKGKRPREKEAEGTQAPNRFEADTVIKSRYELNGQPLEVDPD